MQKIENKQYVIRNYKEEDADKIGQFNFLSMLSYRFNRDFKSTNIFCAVDPQDNILGVGHIVLDQSFTIIVSENKPTDYIHKLSIDICLNSNHTFPEGLPEDLLHTVLTRAQEIKGKYPEKKVRIMYTLPSDELEEIDFFLSNGFTVERNHLVMKCDLTKELPEYPLPEHIKVKNWKMETLAEQEQYLRAAVEGDPEGKSWSLNHLQWTKAGPEWDTFTAFDGDKVVGSVMTWGLGEVKSATENIFVLPEYRRQGIAKAIIIQALKFLRDEKGKKEATLGVFGENGRAIALYRSLGYKMDGVILELGLDI